MRRRLSRTLVGRVVRRYDASHANNWAIIIAWNALFSFVPMFLAVVAGFSLVIGDSNFLTFVRSTVARMSTSRQERADLVNTLVGLQKHRNLLIGVAVIGLLWTGSALFAAMDNGLSALYGVPARSFLRKRLRGAVLMVLFSGLLVPLLLSSALISAGHTYSLLPSGVGEGVIVLAQFFSGLVDATLLFLVIYKVLPNRGHGVRRLFPGALAAGVLLESLTGIFPIYERASNGTASYGVLLALLVLLLLFFYLLGQITVIGGLVNLELDAMRRERRQPELPIGATPVSASAVPDPAPREALTG